jgi:putative FmdB family regulatory protein
MPRASEPRMVQFWIEYSSGGSTVPLYEYQCTKCNKRTEKIESVAGPHLKKCPHCGGRVERLQSAPAIQFKGSGWYVTDYAPRKSGSDGAPGEKTDSKETSKETASKESASKDSASKDSGSKDSKEKKPTKKKD